MDLKPTVQKHSSSSYDEEDDLRGRHFFFQRHEAYVWPNWSQKNTEFVHLWSGILDWI